MSAIPSVVPESSQSTLKRKRVHSQESGDTTAADVSVSNDSSNAQPVHKRAHIDSKSNGVTDSNQNMAEQKSLQVLPDRSRRYFSEAPTSQDLAMLQPCLTPPWALVWSNSNQREYFFNKKTKQSKWERPSGIQRMVPQQLRFRRDVLANLLDAVDVDQYRRRQYQPNHNYACPILTEAELREMEYLRILPGQMIEKEFAFQLVHNECRLPEDENAIFASPAYDVSGLLAHKKHLIDTKNRLNQKDITLWGKHTDLTNVCFDIPGAARRQAHAEMCTKAFLKMFEMLRTYPLLSMDDIRQATPDRPLVTFHLCEAPGAFISATNHFIRSIHPTCPWDWRGVTLNPHYEGNTLGAMIDDDRMILETQRHWLYGADDSGDIRMPENIQAFWNEARRMDGPVRMITADGSVSCIDNPNEQENTTSQLHYCETVCALGLLAPGGSFTVKLFTYFEHANVGLLYLLNSVFRKVVVNKPANSKAGNSETYISCMGFRGIEQRYLDRLLQFTGENRRLDRAMFPLKYLPPNFMRQVDLCSALFSRASASVIRTNLALFKGMNPGLKKYLLDRRRDVADEFLKRFNLCALPMAARRLVPRGPRLDGSRNKKGRSRQQGRATTKMSYEERKIAREKQRLEQQAVLAKARETHSQGDDRKKVSSATTSSPATAAASAILPMSAGLGSASRGGLGASSTSLAGAAAASTARTSSLSSALGSLGSTSNPDANTATHAGVFSDFAKNMMKNMGYVEGKGLGRQKQGIKTNLTLDNQTDNTGLGFGRADVVRSLSRATYETQQQFNEAILNPGSRRWIRVGPSLPAVHLSKFCDSRIIERLNRGRGNLFALVRSMEQLRNALQAAGMTDEVSSFEEDNVRSRLVNIMSDLEAEVELFKIKARDDSFSFVEIHGSAPIASTFIAQRQNDFEFKFSGIVIPFEHGMEAIPTAMKSTTPDMDVVTCDALSTARSLHSLEQVKACTETVLKKYPRGVSMLSIDVLSRALPTAASFLDADRTKRTAELETQEELVCSLLVAMDVLDVGGRFVLRMSDCFTRTSAGVIYILHHLFEKILVLKPSSSSALLPERFIVCTGFRPMPSTAIQRGLITHFGSALEHVINTRAAMEKWKASGCDSSNVLVTSTPIDNHTSAINSVDSVAAADSKSGSAAVAVTAQTTRLNALNVAASRPVGILQVVLVDFLLQDPFWEYMLDMNERIGEAEADASERLIQSMM
jgi:23S rRNA U2552 (ribose-2'-O)-methylase RlmE/FtsJ